MRNLAKTLILMLLSICLFCPTSFGEKFLMKSGEGLTGEIIAFDGKTFRVKSEMGILSIELIDIEKIEGNAEEGVLSIFTGSPSPYEPDRVTGEIEYIREGEMRIKTTYGYVVVYTLPKVTGIDLKPKVPPEPGKKGGAAKVQLRSEPTTFSSEDEIKRMVREKNLSCPDYRIAGMFVPQYEEKTLEGVTVVIEHNTGLIWQKTGSSETMDYTGAQNYVILLNRQRHAGFSDWRLPTMEELLSLMEPVKQGEMFIDPVFETQNAYYWSADKDSSGYVWVVRFSDGNVDDIFNPYCNYYVRAIRSRP